MTTTTWECRCFRTPCSCPVRFGLDPHCANCGTDLGDGESPLFSSSPSIWTRPDGSTAIVCPDGSCFDAGDRPEVHK